MITINLNAIKNILKLATLATLTYLIFSLTSNYNTPTIIKFNSEDTVVIFPNYYSK